jgi:pimeloyl-ACP methyl ester carboxylesterase
MYQSPTPGSNVPLIDGTQINWRDVRPRNMDAKVSPTSTCITVHPQRLPLVLMHASHDRGNNDTLPFGCFDPSTLTGTIARVPESGNASSTSLSDLWAKAAYFAAACKTAQPIVGGLVGTAYDVRDMMQIVDALGEDGKLRYWGLSYGSLLGATAIGMFPDRLDRVILDGVVNPYEYYENSESQQFTDTDVVFTAFCEACVSNQTACPLATGNQTASQLQATLLQGLEDLKQNPIPVPQSSLASTFTSVDYSLIQSQIYSSLKSPSQWPALASILLAVASRNATLLGNVVDVYFTSTQTGAPDAQALAGIKYGDVKPRYRAENLTALLDTLALRRQLSPWFGDVVDNIPTQAAQWPLVAKEIYGGGFNGSHSGQILLIGNTKDPITPLIAAANLAATIPGAVLLEQDGVGVSLSAPFEK